MTNDSAPLHCGQGMAVPPDRQALKAWVHALADRHPDRQALKAWVHALADRHPDREALKAWVHALAGRYPDRQALKAWVHALADRYPDRQALKAWVHALAGRYPDREALKAWVHALAYSPASASRLLVQQSPTSSFSALGICGHRLHFALTESWPGFDSSNLPPSPARLPDASDERSPL